MATKNKTRKCVSKRFKKTAKGKLKFSSPGKRHLASCKSRKRKRQLGKEKTLADCETKRLLSCLTNV